MRKKRWIIQPHDSALIESIQANAGVAPIVAQVLAARGLTRPDHVRQFIESKLTGLRSPDSLEGVNEAVEIIAETIREQKKIFIYGDYDADGMTATAILIRCLRTLGCDASYFVPNRLDDGYGLNNDALSSIRDRGAELVITVDCGVASIESVEFARSIGLKVVVTDHHQTADQLPHANAIVHPALPSNPYPFPGLCGAGVALKLAWALCQNACGGDKVTTEKRDFLLSAVGLAAIGTVADVVPMQDENRILVKHGLKALKYSPTPGISALMSLNGLDQKTELSAEDIAFTIAPRLNAAGRLGQAQLGVELLISDSTDRIKTLAEYIHKLNESRDHLDRSIQLAASKLIKEKYDAENDPGFVLAGRGWHAGVIGIVAGRIASKHNKPTILISLDELNAKPGIGSARSAQNVDLYQLLSRCGDHLISYGGHQAAAGLKIDDDRVEAFRDSFLELLSEELANSDNQATLDIDTEVPFVQLTMQALNQLEALAPFGQDHPRPVFCASAVQLAEPAKRIGGGGRHVSMKLIQNGAKLPGIAFGHGDWADELKSDGTSYDIAFQPNINEYKGRRTVQLQISDWRESELLAESDSQTVDLEKSR